MKFSRVSKAQTSFDFAPRNRVAKGHQSLTPQQKKVRLAILTGISICWSLMLVGRLFSLQISDFETWHAEDGMPRMRAVSASLMLTDNNEFNGPLMLIPGSHHQFVPSVGETPDANWESSLKAQKIGVPEEAVLADLAKRGGIQSPKGPAGSLLLFECNVLHASNGNMSPWPRSNLFFVYNSVDNPLGVPYAAKSERPEYLGARRNVKPLEIHDDFPELAGQGVAPLQGLG